MSGQYTQRIIRSDRNSCLWPVVKILSGESHGLALYKGVALSQGLQVPFKAIGNCEQEMLVCSDSQTHGLPGHSRYTLVANYF